MQIFQINSNEGRKHSPTTIKEIEKEIREQC